MAIDEGQPTLDWWAEPTWWASSTDTSISRNQLIDSWCERSPDPTPDTKVLVGELRGWSAALGRSAWGKDLFDYGDKESKRNSHRAAELAYKSPDAVLNEPAEWMSVCHLYGRYGDPLARLTSSYRFQDDRILRARNLPNRVILQIRDVARKIPGHMRTALIDPNHFYVLRNRETTHTLLAVENRAMHEKLYVLAHHKFMTELQNYADGLSQDIGDGKVDFATFDDVGEVGEHLSLLAQEFGEPPEQEQLRTLTAREKLHIRNVLLATLAANPHLTKSIKKKDQESQEVLGLAWAAAERALGALTAKGIEVTHGGILFTRLAQRRSDEQRRQRRLRERETSLDAGTRDNSPTSSAETSRSRFGAASETANAIHLSELRHLFQGAAEIIQKRHAKSPSWELEFAIRLLTEDGLLEKIQGRATNGNFIRKLVQPEWDGGAPVGTKCSTALVSATVVQSEIRTAMREAGAAKEDIGDFRR